MPAHPHLDDEERRKLERRLAQHLSSPTAVAPGLIAIEKALNRYARRKAKRQIERNRQIKELRKLGALLDSVSKPSGQLNGKSAKRLCLQLAYGLGHKGGGGKELHKIGERRLFEIYGAIEELRKALSNSEERTREKSDRADGLSELTRLARDVIAIFRDGCTKDIGALRGEICVVLRQVAKKVADVKPRSIDSAFDRALEKLDEEAEASDQAEDVDE